MIDLEKFDPTDSNAGMEAAERANRLEAVIRKYLEGTKTSTFVASVRVEFIKALNSHCPSKVE